MNISLTALGAAALTLTWHSEPHATYTLQTSTDLKNWYTVPAVFSGDGLPLTYSSFSRNGSFFARVRSDLDGDTNNNSLPDKWEWQTFGYIDVPPEEDPDGDDFSTFEEWANGTDPLDSYNGERPLLLNRGKSVWNVPSGTLSTDFLNLHLADPSGAPLARQRIDVYTAANLPTLLPTGSVANEARPTCQLETDALGNIHQGNSLHYISLASASMDDQIIVQAGQSILHINIDTGATTTRGIPRKLFWKRIPDQQYQLEWSGDPEDAEGIIVERYDSETGWQMALQMPAAEFPAPDSETGLYRITVPSLL